MKQLFQLSIYVFLFSVVLFACKKDDEVPEEDFPVFGTCKSVNPEGNLSLSGSKNEIFTYETSGGGKIVYRMETHTFTFTHADYPDFSIQFWGGKSGKNVFSAAHENLNGYLIKDKLGDSRSLIFPDGAKITIVCADNFGALLSATIYDGKECHRINLTCNNLEYSSANSAYTKLLDDAEADGETCTFEITKTGLLFDNIYIEEMPGQKVVKRVPLGELFKDDPKRIAKYWADASLPVVDKLLTDVIRTADVAELKTHAMEVYAGTTPPIINGTVKLSPWRFDYAKPSIGITPGQIQKDITVEFSGQTAGKQAIVVKFAGDYLKETKLISPFITGSGNKFTVCFKTIVATISGNLVYFNNYAYLISGSVDGTNLKNVKMAIVVIKSAVGNVASPYIEGDIAIYSDSDGISERTNP